MGSVHLISSSNYTFYRSVFPFCTSSQSTVTLHPSEKNYPLRLDQNQLGYGSSFSQRTVLGDNIFNLPSRLGALNVRVQDKDMIGYPKVMQSICYLQGPRSSSTGEDQFIRSLSPPWQQMTLLAIFKTYFLYFSNDLLQNAFIQTGWCCYDPCQHPDQGRTTAPHLDSAKLGHASFFARIQLWGSESLPQPALYSHFHPPLIFFSLLGLRSMVTHH